MLRNLQKLFVQSPMYCQSNNWWIFCNILWPSQACLQAFNKLCLPQIVQATDLIMFTYILWCLLQQPQLQMTGVAFLGVAPPDFSRSVNYISTRRRGADYAHLITSGTPGFSDLPTALHDMTRLSCMVLIVCY